MFSCGSCSARTLPSKFVCCECIIFASHSRQRVIKDSHGMIDRFSKEISDILQLREPKTSYLLWNKKRRRAKALRDLILQERKDLGALNVIVERLKESNRARRAKIVKHKKQLEKFDRNHRMLIHSHDKLKSLLERRRIASRKWSNDLTEAFVKLLPLVKPNGKGYHCISHFYIADHLLPLKPMAELVRRYISAGLGAVVLFTQVLAKYYHFTMPHRMKFQCSSSRIFDPNYTSYPIYLPSGSPTDDECENVCRALQLLDQNVLALCEHASSSAMPKRLFQRGGNQFLSNLLLLINVNREEQRYIKCRAPSFVDPLENGLLTNLPMFRRPRSSGSRPSFEHPPAKKS